MRKKRGVEYWEEKRDRIKRQRRSDWWGWGGVKKRRKSHGGKVQTGRSTVTETVV